MNPPPVGWHLVLEFVKVLAAPTAAVLAVWIASVRAVHGFRAQKSIERRLDWYEWMIIALIDIPVAYSRADGDGGDTNAPDAVDAQIDEILARIPRGTLYADKRGLVALRQWAREVQAVAPAGSATTDDVDRLREASAEAASVLAREVRKDLRLKKLEQI